MKRKVSELSLSPNAKVGRVTLGILCLAVLLSVIVASLVCTPVEGADSVGEQFTEKYEGVDVKYEVTSETPNEVKVILIGDSWMSGYKGNVTIPENVTHGGAQYSVTAIYDKAFYYSDVVSVVIPDSVITIGERAFQGCSSMTSVFMGAGVTTINNNAFRNCSYLASLNLSSSVATISDYAFYGCSFTSMNLPASVATVGAGAFTNCNSLASITVDVSNQKFCSVDGILFDKDKTTLVLYPNGKVGTEYEIPTGVTTIGNGAFLSNPSLKSLKIDGVITIGNIAFGEMYSLESMTIPASVTTIGDDVFYYDPIDVYFMSTTPASVGSNALSSVSSIYVLHGYEETYKTATGWGGYANKIGGLVSTSSIPDPVSGLVYDGTTQTGVPVSADDPFVITGNTEKDAGDYVATLTLKEKMKWLDDYSTDEKTINWSIAKKSVTVSGITAQNKEYDGNTDAKLVFDNVVINGLVSGDSLSVTAKGTFADAEIGNGKTVNITDLKLQGTSLPNYVLASTGQQTTTTADIIDPAPDYTLVWIVLCIVLGLVGVICAYLVIKN